MKAYFYITKNFNFIDLDGMHIISIISKFLPTFIFSFAPKNSKMRNKNLLTIQSDHASVYLAD